MGDMNMYVRGLKKSTECSAVEVGQVGQSDMADDHDASPPPWMVVGYEWLGSTWAWCGWCRQWSAYGLLRRPARRLSQCRKARRPDSPCRTVGRELLVVPVPAPPGFALKAGDGVPGTQMPHSSRSSVVVPTVPAYAIDAEHDAVPRAVRKTARAASAGGWAVELLHAIGPDVTRRDKRQLHELIVLRINRSDQPTLVMCYVDGKFDMAAARRVGLLGAAAAKALIKQPMQHEGL